MSGKWLAASSILAFVAVACTAASAELTLAEYAEAMQRVESQFRSDAPNPAGRPEGRDQYPLGGDLVIANELYMEFERRLAGWRGIIPPPSVSQLHDELVAALDAVQSEVGEYLTDEAMTGTDFDFDTIGPAVEPFLETASVACRDLRSAVRASGADVDFADNCNF